MSLQEVTIRKGCVLFFFPFTNRHLVEPICKILNP